VTGKRGVRSRNGNDRRYWGRPRKDTAGGAVVGHRPLLPGMYIEIAEIAAFEPRMIDGALTILHPAQLHRVAQT